MVGFSKLLIGAFIPSAYGSGKVEPETSALTAAPTARIRYHSCADTNGTLPGFFFMDDGEECNVTSIAKSPDENKIESWTICPGKEIHRYITRKNEEIKLQETQGGGEVFKLTPDGQKFSVGGAGTYSFDGKEFCVLIDFNKPAEKNLLVKLTSVGDQDRPQSVQAKDLKPVVLADNNKKVVEESAFFGEANGEWSIIDVAFIAVIGVLLLCFCLGLYSCWAQKKKNKEKDCAANRPAKYNHRRQLAIE